VNFSPWAVAARRSVWRVVIWCLLAGAGWSMGGCASTSKVTSGENGAGIAAAQAESYRGPKARIAVGSIIDKSAGAGDHSLTHQLELLNRGKAITPVPSATSVTSGIRDLLTTALFNSNRYIVLERENIKDVLVEQDFAATGRVGDESHIPMGEIEGVELLLVGAITGFDAGVSGGAVPIPIPINHKGDMVTVDLSFKRAFISMDLRIIDVKTSRVVATVAVEGSTTKFGAALSGYLRNISSGGYVRLPGVLTGFQNTPVEQAISKMVQAAVNDLTSKTPEVYYREQDAGTEAKDAGTKDTKATIHTNEPKPATDDPAPAPTKKP
jgi:curli biogenesis system outer membrane secretion channel CsgG